MQNHPDSKKYYKCMFDNCPGFDLFDGSSSSASVSNNNCFSCGLPGHWMTTCPWRSTTCPNNCSNPRRLLTSQQPQSKGKKFLKCNECGNFEWLADAIAKTNKARLNIRVKIEVSLDDLCNKFQSM